MSIETGALRSISVSEDDETIQINVVQTIWWIQTLYFRLCYCWWRSRRCLKAYVISFNATSQCAFCSGMESNSNEWLLKNVYETDSVVYMHYFKISGLHQRHPCTRCTHAICGEKRKMRRLVCRKCIFSAFQLPPCINLNRVLPVLFLAFFEKNLFMKCSDMPTAKCREEKHSQMKLEYIQIERMSNDSYVSWVSTPLIALSFTRSSVYYIRSIMLMHWIFNHFRTI